VDGVALRETLIFSGSTFMMFASVLEDVNVIPPGIVLDADNDVSKPGVDGERYLTKGF
jgi:hypothetical protein